MADGPEIYLCREAPRRALIARPPVEGVRPLRDRKPALGLVVKGVVRAAGRVRG